MKTQTSTEKPLLPIPPTPTTPPNLYNAQSLQSNQLLFEVATTQLPGATSIDVVDQVVYQNITKGDIITFYTQDLYTQYQNKNKGSVAGFEVDADGLRKGGIEITGWLDSDAMAGASANNVPTAESVKAYVDASAGAIQNFSFCDCTATSVTNSTAGEVNAVVIAFDTEQTVSTSNNITLYGSGGIPGFTGGAYSWRCDKAAFWQFNWSITTDTNVSNNRMVSGVKLQSGSIEGEAVTWSDLDPSHSYIYNRGTGSMREGSTANQFIIQQASVIEPRYYRIVFWKQASSTASTTAITILRGTNLIIKEI